MVCPHCAFPNLPGVSICAKCRRPLDGKAPAASPDWMKAPEASPSPPPEESGDSDVLAPILEREKSGDLRGAFLLGQDLLIERHGDLPPDVVARAYVVMARLSLGLQKNERAEKYLQRARALRPEDPEIARLAASMQPAPSPSPPKSEPVVPPPPPVAPATGASPEKTAVAAAPAPVAQEPAPQPVPEIPKKSALGPPPLPLSAALTAAAAESEPAPAPAEFAPPAPIKTAAQPAQPSTPAQEIVDIAGEPPPPPLPRMPEAAQAPPAEPPPAGPEAGAFAAGAPRPARPVRPDVSQDGRACLAAGFWLRALALVLDEILIGAILAVVVTLGSLILGQGGSGLWKALPEQPGTLGALLVLFFASSLAYLTLFGAIGGQTLGKMILGLRVVTRSGHSLGAGRALLRLAGMILAAIPGLAGFLWAGFDRERRGWHDYLGGTLVVRLRLPRGMA